MGGGGKVGGRWGEEGRKGSGRIRMNHGACPWGELRFVTAYVQAVLAGHPSFTWEKSRATRDCAILCQGSSSCLGFTIKFQSVATNHCANDGGTCECNGEVRYGKGSQWSSWKSVYGRPPLAHHGGSSTKGSIACGTPIFGDPAVGVAKTCECREAFLRCRTKSTGMPSVELGQTPAGTQTSLEGDLYTLVEREFTKCDSAPPMGSWVHCPLQLDYLDRCEMRCQEGFHLEAGSPYSEYCEHFGQEVAWAELPGPRCEPVPSGCAELQLSSVNVRFFWQFSIYFPQISHFHRYPFLRTFNVSTGQQHIIYGDEGCTVYCKTHRTMVQKSGTISMQELMVDLSPTKIGKQKRGYVVPGDLRKRYRP